MAAKRKEYANQPLYRTASVNSSLAGIPICQACPLSFVTPLIRLCDFPRFLARREFYNFMYVPFFSRPLFFPESQKRVEERIKAAMVEMPLAELRQARKITQQQIADTLKIKQASVSKMESQTDMYISTMRKYIQAMGGELEIMAKFPEGNVKVDTFEGLDLQ